jgi:hypothetical protein
MIVNGKEVIFLKEAVAYFKVRGPFEKFGDWWQCAAVMKRES